MGAVACGGGSSSLASKDLEDSYVVSPMVVANFVVPPLNATIFYLVDAPHVALAPGGVVSPLLCGGGSSALAGRDLGYSCGLDGFG